MGVDCVKAFAPAEAPSNSAKLEWSAAMNSVKDDFRRLERCRLCCPSQDLISVLNLGLQELTGVFPRSDQEPITRGPLELVWCRDCGSVQLAHSYNREEMYGENYGYRSGLNNSMVRHLANKVYKLERLVVPQHGDVVLDIGSNDCTTLKAYKTAGLRRIGIDPTGSKFREFYPPEVKLVSDFFSAENYRSAESEPARIVTSIAMFYDLEDPVGFARQVAEVLADDGVWHFEQSYMPSMLRLTSYDTICHEHLEYYSMSTVKRILMAADMRLLDVEMNAVNGGSFAVSAVKKTSPRKSNDILINWLIEQEDRMGLQTPRPYRDFEERVFRHRQDLIRLVRTLRADGKKILGYGASTKGNVVLQFCGFGPEDIAAIAEVNAEKFDRVTPGTHIPIVSEDEAHAMQPDYFLVLPWHFKDSIIQREREYLSRDGKMIFPFPEIEII